MPTFEGLLVVCTVAFAAPFLVGLAPSLRLPSVVAEIVLGIVVGPSVLGLVEIDPTIEVLSLVGLAFILFLSGLEIEFEQLRGRPLRMAGMGWALSFAIAIAAGLALRAAGFADDAMLVAIILCATSLGVVVAVLKDADEVMSPFGQLIVAAGSFADFGAIILLSLFFSGEGGVGSTVLLLGCLVGVAVAAVGAVRGAGHLRPVARLLARLQDTTAQIRVRGAMVLLIGFVALAESFGLEAILGAFAAGAILSLVDRDRAMTHPGFRRKLDAVGFGFVIPIFFVASGVRFDLQALLDDPSNVAMVPVFLAALLVVRGVPAVLYRGLVGGRRAGVAALLQATSLPFIVAATAIGQELGLISSAQASGLVAAGLLSVLLFPAAALALLRGVPAGVVAPAAASR